MVFSWDQWPLTDNRGGKEVRVLGQHNLRTRFSGLEYSIIRIHATNTGTTKASPTGLNARTMDRLGILLYECAHALAKQNRCSACPTLKFNDGRRGHARAWQLVAAAIEEVIPSLLGLPLNLNRFGSLRYHWDVLDALPSEQNLATWKLGAQGTAQNCAKRRRPANPPSTDREQPMHAFWLDVLPVLVPVQFLLLLQVGT